MIMDSAAFFERFKAFLEDLNPGVDLDDLSPDAHLWEMGYIDSFAMLNVVAFVEDETGREITLDRDVLSNFFTVERIYRTYFQQDEVVQ